MTGEEREGTLRDLRDALVAFLAHEEAAGESSSELLARNPRLRELLEPLLVSAVREPNTERFGLPEAQLGDFRLLRPLGRGGMGAVFEARQLSLDRLVALKVLPAERSLDPRSLTRFQREATAAGRLVHPGIVAVYAVGEDRGLHYIAQELVEGGRTLADLVDEQRREERGSAEHHREVASLFVRIAEAVAAAHACGVVHRDLKPQNVLLAPDGSPKVADFGLARLSDSTTLSRTGEIAGSPSYMAPEQARPDLGPIDERTDVYGLGATLYEALTLTRPFAGDTTQQVLHKVVHEDPLDPRALRSRIPVELASICLKALEKRPEKRYAGCTELARDLRAFLENRPVHARPAGRLERLLKWTRRHPVIAATGAVSASALVVVSASLVFALRSARAERASALAAHRDAARVRVQKAELLLEDLPRRADDLWPALAREPQERDEDVLARFAAWEHEVESLGEEIAALAADPRLEPELREAGASLAQRHRALLESREGPLGDLSAAHGWGVPRRARFAAAIRARSLEESAARAAWERACASIADARECPAYGGLVLRPQLGLLPLGRDPHSGLWEFAHLMSGEPPARDAGGRWALDEHSAIVLVLVPGGSFRMGAQRADPEAPCYDPGAQDHELEGGVVELAPFFLAKHELTQAQWSGIVGRNPSYFDGSGALGLDPSSGRPYGPLHPLESVSRDECTTWLARMDLALPTEAQWEYAARAGTSTRWWSGEEESRLMRAGNLASDSFPDPDGWTNTAPVGSYAANPFGLHDVLGNVMEWVADPLVYYPDVIPRPGDGLRSAAQDKPTAVVRGGAYDGRPEYCRSSERNFFLPSAKLQNTGVRAARVVR